MAPMGVDDGVFVAEGWDEEVGELVMATREEVGLPEVDDADAEDEVAVALADDEAPDGK